MRLFCEKNGQVGDGHRQMEGIEVEKMEKILCDRVLGGWGVGRGN